MQKREAADIPPSIRQSFKASRRLCIFSALLAIALFAATLCGFGNPPQITMAIAVGAAAIAYGSGVNAVAYGRALSGEYGAAKDLIKKTTSAQLNTAVLLKIMAAEGAQREQKGETD